MASRSVRAKIARETLQIIKNGQYRVAGQSVDLSDSIGRAINATRLYRPDELQELSRAAPRQLTEGTDIETHNCTTFAGVRLLISQGYVDPACLNFASAKNPGGGFIGGSQAQEECLARASALYGCINPVEDYYETNRASKTALYTDHIIYSPRVPVFRDDDDALIEQAYQTSIITAPAVNAGAVDKNEPQNRKQIEPVMRQRIDYVLTVAANENHDSVVLGAWGCGVFRNDPADVARWFADSLGGQFRNVFRKVVFAVLTRESHVIAPFEQILKQ